MQSWRLQYLNIIVSRTNEVKIEETVDDETKLGDEEDLTSKEEELAKAKVSPANFTENITQNS